MSYRDDLGQAHRRIEQLEEQLREAKESPKPKGKGNLLLLLVVGAAALAISGGIGGVIALRGDASGPMRVAYVDEVASNRQRFEGHRMRMQGYIVEGSIAKKAGNACEVKFSLERNGALIPVRELGCVVPDLFGRPGTLVTVEGDLRKDEFMATQVLVTADL